MPSDDRPLHYLVGTSGHPNYGDELIAATWLRYLARVSPHSDVWLDCPSPGPAAVLLGDLHPRVRFTDTLWRLCWEAPTDEPWEVSAYVQRVMEDPGVAPRWLRGVELVARADVVHVMGGGYINDIWPAHVGLLAGAVAAVRRSGGSAVATGLGLSPVATNGNALLRHLAAQLDVLDVRDALSVELVGSAATPLLTGDDAFFGLGPHLYRSDGDLRPVMVCIQSDFVEVGVPALAEFLADTLRAWQVTGDSLGVVEGIPGADRTVFALVERAFPGARFYPFSEIWETGFPAAAGQTWISTRFHPHLLAAAVGATGVALSVGTSYYATKHRSLTGQGSGWTIVDDLSQPPERPGGTGFDRSRVAELRAAKAALAATIYPPPPSASIVGAGPPARTTTRAYRTWTPATDGPA